VAAAQHRPVWAAGPLVRRRVVRGTDALGKWALDGRWSDCYTMEPSRLSVSVVVFDLGEVLAAPSGLLLSLAERAGTDEATLTAAYWAFRDLYDRGGDADTFWTSVLGDARVAFDADLVRTLSEHDSTAWTTLRPDARETLAELHDAGVKVAVLSNAPRELAAAARQADWAVWIDDWFFSGELGMAKPDDALYAAVTSALGVDESEIVFFDDRQVNVDAARRAGWDAHLWTSGAAVRDTLRTMGLLPR
jgi:putative hydrolase of the HAD superfamily